MTLEEAIRIQRLSRGDLAYETQKDVSQAKKLGIEALKRVIAGRPAPPSLAYLPLPGETTK